MNRAPTTDNPYADQIFQPMELADLRDRAQVYADRCINPRFKRAAERLADAADNLLLLREEEAAACCEEGHGASHEPAQPPACCRGCQTSKHCAGLVENDCDCLCADPYDDCPGCDFMTPHPVGRNRPPSDVRGIGPALTEKLERAGVHNLEDLAKVDDAPSLAMKVGRDPHQMAGFVEDARRLAADLNEKRDAARVRRRVHAALAGCAIGCEASPTGGRVEVNHAIGCRNRRMHVNVKCVPPSPGPGHDAGCRMGNYRQEPGGPVTCDCGRFRIAQTTRAGSEVEEVEVDYERGGVRLSLEGGTCVQYELGRAFKAKRRETDLEAIKKGAADLEKRHAVLLDAAEVAWLLLDRGDAYGEDATKTMVALQVACERLGRPYKGDRRTIAELRTDLDAKLLALAEA